jgi:hypothetical protein
LCDEFPPPNIALPINAVLLTVPEDSELVAVAAPVPCLNPFGGRSQGGFGGGFWLTSSCFIFAASATEDVTCEFPLPELFPTPDDFTRFVCATRSRNLLSNLVLFRKINVELKKFKEGGFLLINKS